LIKQRLTITGGSKCVIHITGAAGCGKSTLGQRLKNCDKFTVIELDDIDDSVALKLMSEDKYLKLICSEDKQDNNKFLEEKSKLVVSEINKLVHKSKIPIIVGRCVDLKTVPITHKYYINTEPKKLFKQCNLRTLNDIVNNYDEIKSLIENKSPEEVHHIMLYKYKIRVGFLRTIQSVKNSLDNDSKKLSDYKSMASDEIYDEIISKFN